MRVHFLGIGHTSGACQCPAGQVQTPAVSRATLERFADRIQQTLSAVATGAEPTAVSYSVGLSGLPPLAQAGTMTTTISRMTRSTTSRTRQPSCTASLRSDSFRGAARAGPSRRTHAVSALVESTRALCSKLQRRNTGTKRSSRLAAQLRAVAVARLPRLTVDDAAAHVERDPTARLQDLTQFLAGPLDARLHA